MGGADRPGRAVPPPVQPVPVPVKCTAVHERRLRDIWRSAGWPCHDNIELDLLAAGLVRLQIDGQGRETLRPTTTGIQRLAAKRQRHQAAMTAHEALVQRVALQQQRAGRVVWCGLTLRAPLALPEAEAPRPQPAPLTAALLDGPGAADNAPPSAVQWALAMPDVYAIRHTTVEACVEPAAYEIKVSRADLLGDLRRPAKAAAYLALASQCWYVLKRGIADVDEIPPPFGVMWADDTRLDVARPALVRPFRLPFAVWMALARAPALAPPDDDGRAMI